MRALTIVIAMIAVTACNGTNLEDKGKVELQKDHIVSPHIYKTTVDGHDILHRYNGGLMHSPGCPCFNK